MTTVSQHYPTPQARGAPDFRNIEAVLRKSAPARPTLFEFFMNRSIYEDLAGARITWDVDPMSELRLLVKAFTRAGYDYVTWSGSTLRFPRGDESLGGFRAAGGVMIRDRRSFDAYPWPDPTAYDYSTLDRIAGELPRGMKLIVHGPGGVLENAVALVGFENLAYLIADDPALASDVFERIGTVITRHYERVASHPCVGACISNDDWGFKTQPMLSPDAMRRYVLPQHRRIVGAIHAAGRPAILHSCGNQAELYDDIIDGLQYDGKHSYEDAIEPVEEAYERYGRRIAILGGIDLDFICRSTPQEVYGRARAMLERTAARGSYALGTGNSVPDFVPRENFYALLAAALDQRSAN